VVAEKPGAAEIAEELAACRQRGIERLDVSSHYQVPVQTPVLEGLASKYAEGGHVDDAGIALTERPRSPNLPTPRCA
jgi:hypothetical protein